ncbi:hypothetical protein [Haliangium sp. UPWRP_2]|uniref:hypothetical protein n=1 Tax=Haliangium sp. UPWRP_2 TaxID=1931276 RepID=UPI000D0CED9F|nr:hypothetical protein [Haliangium sp. UPWRP_2]PSM30879.1 hypothetical protein BVG81_008270 [Haliangium sp. UPWRP_2]
MHRAYGQALGLTTVPAVAAETVPLRDPLLALSSALRLYVIKVIAHRDDDKPETVALADRLLRPLAAWTGKSPKSNLDSEPPPAPRPEPVPAPAPAPAAG